MKATGTIIPHLIEIRDRLLKILLVVGCLFICACFFAQDLFEALAAPLLKILPDKSQLIATGLPSVIFVPLKFALFSAVFLCIPYILYQTWSFVVPGLYQRERTLGLFLLVSSCLLFYTGVIFAYTILFPLVFNFIIHFAPSWLNVMPDINQYLSFCLKMFFAFGIAFEIPIVTIFLIYFKITTREFLASKRPYVIVFCFTLGMLLTPPDVISQILLAVPMLLLFEAGLWIAKYIPHKEESPQEDS